MSYARMRDAVARFWSVQARVDGLLIVMAAVIFFVAGSVVEAILCALAFLYGAKKVIVG